MQVTGSAVAVPNAATPYTPPAKAVVGTASTRDLESTLPPVQPLEVTNRGSTATSNPVLVYNRFAQLSQSPSTANPPSTANQSGEESLTPASQEDAIRQSLTPVSDGAEQRQTPSRDNAPQGEGGAPDSPESSPTTQAAVTEGEPQSPATVGGLTEEELQVVQELAARDREVRNHEQAHLAVGGQYASAPQFSYQRGPDGRNYAVGGEVPIDVGTVPGNPEATIQKLEQVRRAALAPGEPSPQDRSVAASATQGIIQARAELAEQQRENRLEEEQQREERRQASEAQDGERERRSEAIQTYEQLIGLGQQLDGGVQEPPQLSEVI